jgi:predicted transcriptional regulator
MKEKILQQISDKFANTNGGITINELMELNNLKFDEIKPFLNLMYKQGLLRIKQGINQQLVYLKN